MEEARKPDPEELLAHARDLRRLARALVSDPNAADDLAQDAWIELLEKRADQEKALERPAWLFGLMRNLRREHARRDGRRARREATVARAQEIGGEHEIVERLETFRALARELEQLDEPYRTSLWQRFFENETAERIAAREGVSPATVRSRWMRGLAMLRERLDRGAGGRERWFTALCLIADVERTSREPRVAGSLIGATALLAGIVATAHLAVPGGSSARPLDATPVVATVATARDELVELEPVTRRALDAAFAAAPSETRSALRLVLVDAYTREILPAARVRIRDADGASDWTTDDDGRIVTTALAHGTLGVEVQDGAKSLPGEARAFRRSRRIVHDGRDEIELAVASGPTWRLAIDAPAEVSRAELVARLETRFASGPRSSATAPVIVDAPSSRAWVRFGADGGALAGGGPWILRVATKDERFAGEASVGTLRGRATDPVEIRLVERAELLVHVRDGAGRPLDAEVEVVADSGARLAGATERGDLLARGLPPGNARVFVRVFGLAPREAEVEARLPSTTVAIVFDEAVERDRISGVVRHVLARGQSAHVRLRDARGVELVRTITNADGLAHGAYSFVFDDVPVGEHVLSVESRDVWRWDPPSVRVVPPAVGLSLAAAPAASDASFVVRARDAETGAPIEHFDVRLEVDRAAPLERSTSIAGMTFPALPDDARVAWVVAAPGYATARGDETAIRIHPDRRMLEIALRRGFAARVRVVDDFGGQPLAGVAILADEREVARTDERGLADVALGAMPRALDARLAGFVVGSGDVDARTGAWRTSEVGRVEIRLAPRR